MKVFRIFVLMVFLMIGSSQMANAAESSLSSAEKERLTQQLIDKKDFIGLFKNAKKIGYRNEHNLLVITDAVSKYIKSCCNSEGDIVALLEKNGFSVHLSEATNKNPKAIIGQKYVSTFLIMGLTYKIYFDFEDEKLVNIDAYVIPVSI